MRGSLRVGWLGWTASHWQVALHLGSPLVRRRMPGNASSSASLPGIRGQTFRSFYSAVPGPRPCAAWRTAGSLENIAAAGRTGRLAGFYRARLRP